MALVIFSLIGLGSHAMLQSVISARAATQAKAAQLTQLQKAIWIMTQDAIQIDPASMKPTPGGVEFLRGGWPNPLALTRSNRRYVAYALIDGALTGSYRSADMVDAPIQRQILLEGVTDFAWQKAGPRLIEITWTSARMGTLRRFVEVPDS